MPTAQRRFDHSIIQQLLDAPYRFGFFQTLRLLEQWIRQSQPEGEDLLEHYVRFQNRLSLSFPASELDAIHLAHDETHEQPSVRHADEVNGLFTRVLITPNFMGLLGSNGVLPSHYTETMAQYLSDTRDDGPKAFLDMFTNRTLMLFYQAWRKYRLIYQSDTHGQDAFIPHLLALAGLGKQSLATATPVVGGGVSRETIAYYAAAIRQRPVSAVYIQQVLTEYFGVPIRLEQFIGGWFKVPVEQQSSLGVTGAALGKTAMVGSRVWQRDLRLRVWIGPLVRSVFDQFLPGQRSAKALEKMLTTFTGFSFEYEIQLILRHDQVSPLALSDNSEQGRLGWSSFLPSSTSFQDRCDVKYRIQAL